MAHDDDDGGGGGGGGDDALHVYTVFVCLFVFGATAPTGSGPPHSRGFQITHNDAP